MRIKEPALQAFFYDYTVASVNTFPMDGFMCGLTLNTKEENLVLLLVFLF